MKLYLELVAVSSRGGGTVTGGGSGGGGRRKALGAAQPDGQAWHCLSNAAYPEGPPAARRGTSDGFGHYGGSYSTDAHQAH